jgi:hypothetical protein
VCRRLERVDYWLDLGNNTDSGQFVLGEPLNRRNRRHKLRLRTVSELFPEVLEEELDDDGLPSCSAMEALDRQEPFVNSTLANHALALLARLFRYGTISKEQFLDWLGWGVESGAIRLPEEVGAIFWPQVSLKDIFWVGD